MDLYLFVLLFYWLKRIAEQYERGLLIIVLCYSAKSNSRIWFIWCIAPGNFLLEKRWRVKFAKKCRKFRRAFIAPWNSRSRALKQNRVACYKYINTRSGFLAPLYTYIHIHKFLLSIRSFYSWFVFPEAVYTHRIWITNSDTSLCRAQDTRTSAAESSVLKNPTSSQREKIQASLVRRRKKRASSRCWPSAVSAAFFPRRALYITHKGQRRAAVDLHSPTSPRTKCRTKSARSPRSYLAEGIYFPFPF